MTKQRSPNFPGVDLAEAVKLTQKLYDRERRSPFPAESAAAAWEYKGPSGPVRVRIGALRQYGLIAREGKDSKLTDRAITLVLRNSGSREHHDALRAAALTPELFRELQETRADASDESLKHHLIVEKSFTPEGADRCIKAYRGTINAAMLTESNIISRSYDDEFPDTDEEEPMVIEAPHQRTVDPIRSGVPQGSIAIPIPLDAERMATVTVPIDMGTADWIRLDRILQAYKPENLEGSGTTGESTSKSDT